MKWLFSKLFPTKDPTAPENERLIRLFEDDTFPSSILPKDLWDAIAAGASVDEIPNAFGEFGVTLTNPIPVNGAAGEIAYLSSLRHRGKEALFHRLGSFEAIDIYEIVDIDGSDWQILYFDMYHPRRSRKAPKGYTLASGNRASYAIYGVNHLVPNFPAGLANAIRDVSEVFLGRSLVPPALVQAEKTVRFVRPQKHLRLRDDIEVQAARRAATHGEVADVIVALAQRDAEQLFPSYREDVRRFWSEQGMLNDVRQVVYDHPYLTVALNACIAVTWYCSVVELFSRKDAEMLAKELAARFKAVAAETPNREAFEAVFNEALNAGVASANATEATKMKSPGFGIANALFSSLEMLDDAAKPTDEKLRQDFILRFWQPFHFRSSEVFELGVKYAMTEA